MSDRAVHLIFVVEGYTEEALFNRVLLPHLAGHDLQVQGATIVGKTKAKKRDQPQRGGGKYSDWVQDLRRITANPNPAFRFTTLFDLYGLPDDFPERGRQVSDRSNADRCDRLEQVLADQIDDWRFIPYLQLHEFEALVLACLPHLEALSVADALVSTPG